MLVLTTTATMIQIGIHRMRDNTIIVPTIFALMNITAHMHIQYTVSQKTSHLWLAITLTHMNGF